MIFSACAVPFQLPRLLLFKRREGKGNGREQKRLAVVSFLCYNKENPKPYGLRDRLGIVPLGKGRITHETLRQ